MAPRRFRAPVALAALALWLACGAPPPEEDGPPLVLVSVAPQAEFVRRLAGERVEVEVMIPPGATPETYEPTIEQLLQVQDAALYVKLGHPRFPFERTWLDSLLDDRPDLPVANASEGLEPSAVDPHLWLSPRHARRMAANTAAALVRLLPDERAAIERNLKQLEAEIVALDRELREMLGAFRGASFLVLHPAWTYLAQEYGLEQLSIERDGKEPDAHALAALIERARAERIEVVFAAPQLDPSGAEVVADAIGGRVERLDPLAEDWEESLRNAARRIASQALSARR